jgi:NADP oxidoreductase coenzyme F420-dependent
MSQPLNIGVLGSGSAGRTLATGFLGHGYPVMIGSRDPSKLQDWLQHAGPQAQIGTFAETAEFGDLVVLSVNGRAAEDVIRFAGIASLNGKIVLDASDPLDFTAGRPGLFVGTTDSLGERIQRLIPNRRGSAAGIRLAGDRYGWHRERALAGSHQSRLGRLLPPHRQDPPCLQAGRQMKAWSTPAAPTCSTTLSSPRRSGVP